MALAPFSAVGLATLLPSYYVHLNFWIDGFPVVFSSRSRHTSCLRDWSSDVCSSDLITEQPSMAFRIASLLRPASVLGIGNGIAALLESLASCGVAGITHAASVEQLACLAGEYDLAVYADATDQARSMIQAAAGRSEEHT